MKLLQNHKSTLLFLGLCLVGKLVHGQTYNFTTAGATGISGPTQAQINTAYAATNLSGNVTVTGGIQNWTVPVGGLYKIEVYGAKGYGPFAGRGAYMSGEFNLNSSEVLKILVGQLGGCCVVSGTEQYGGGGGTFVVSSTNTPLIIAGGGGGVNGTFSAIPANSDASITTSGNNGVGTSGGVGGTNGSGGAGVSNAGGGGGFSGDGGAAAGNPGGYSFLNGGVGGTAVGTSGGWGGFGGGGGANSWNNRRGGGGGGYSGGGGAGSGTSSSEAGGGGGSFNSGNNQVNTPALGTGDGLVVITLIAQAASLPNNVGALGFPGLAGGICSGLQPVSVKVRNFGNNYVNSVKIGWEVNGVLQNDLVYSVALDTFPVAKYDTTITLGTYNFALGIPYTIRAWTSLPNNQADPVNANDTSSMSVTVLLSGNFTLNAAQPTGGTNYQTFTAFVNDLNTYGICGPVVLDVVPGSGPYTEQITIPQINGANAVNTITINGNGNTLGFASTNSNQRAVITLNGADYLTIDSLVINANSGTYGWGVHLTNDANFNTIKRCTINSSPTVTTTNNFTPIVLNGSPTTLLTTGIAGNNNLITANTLNGGYYGVVLYGNTSTPNTGNIVSNNVIRDFYAYGCAVSYMNGALISSNDISRPNRTGTTTAAGVFLTTGTIATLAEKNKVHNMYDALGTNAGTFYGLYSAADALSGQTNKFINNTVYNINHNGPAYGIYNAGGDYMVAYHNSITLDHAATTTGTSWGIYQTTAATGIEYINNIISITRGGTGTKRCVHFNTTTSTINSNNNLFYLNAPAGTDNHVGQFGTLTYNTLALWQSGANGGIYDALSVNADPLFANATAGDLTPTNPLIDNIGTPLGITTDLPGNTRSPTFPDLGAYEFAGPPCNTTPTAGTTIAIPSQSKYCLGMPVTINLNGQTAGTGQNYQLLRSPVISGPYTTVGSPQPSPLFNITTSTVEYYRIAVTCGSGMDTSTPILINAPPLPSGVFTINSAQPTGGTNFASFNEAIASLNCGISGPIVFNVDPASGPYNEQVFIPQISGVSATNTITINGNGRTLGFASTVSAQRATITLDGADYVTIDSLVVNATAGTYGWGIHFINEANNNTISRCTVNASPTVVTTNYFVPIVMSASTSTILSSGNTGNNNLITGNTTNGGYYGIVLYGNSAANSQNVNNIATNNIIRDPYGYSITMAYQKNAIISLNDIARPTRTGSTTTAGVFVTTGCLNVLVERNRVHNMFDAMGTNASTIYGFYDAADALSGQENKFFNNAVYNINHNGPAFGLYNAGGDYMQAYHNTITLDDPATTTGTAYGLYQTTAAVGLDYKNNIAVVTRGGTGIKRCVHFNTTTSTITSNNNLFYMNAVSGTDNHIGQFGSTTYSTLALWQANANGGIYDNASVEADPMFVNAGTGNLTPNNASIDNLGTPVGLTVDILGNARSLTNPDLGAFEFSVPLLIKLTGITAVNAGKSNIVSWTSEQEDEGDYFELERSADAIHFSKLSTLMGRGQASRYNFMDDHPLDGINYYRLRMIDRSGAAAYSRIVEATVKPSVNLIAAHPNPVKDVVTVSFNGTRGMNPVISVSDMTGRLLQSTTLSDEKAVLNMTGWAPGIYLLQYTDSQQSQTMILNKQ